MKNRAKKLLKIVWVTMALCLLLCTSIISLGQNTKKFVYAGSFTGKGSKGIYAFTSDPGQGKLKKVQTISIGNDPSFLAVSPDQKNLYAIYSSLKGDSSGKKRQGSVVSFRINPSRGLLTKINSKPSLGRGPAHISVDPKGRFLYISNYGSGTLAVYKINANGSIGESTDVIQDEGSGPHPNQKGPHVHAAIPSPDGRFVYVCDLGIDKVLIYEVTEPGKLVPASMPYYSCVPGSGPRQFAISPDGKHAFLVEEFVSRLVSFNRDPATGVITPLQHLEMIPEGIEERASDATVYVSPDSKFVYASNWGPTGLLGYAIDERTGHLNEVEKEPLHGSQPRDFCIDKSGRFVFVANMGSGELAIFKRNLKTGKLDFEQVIADIPGISCIVEFP